jgi:putative DNA primase/helicase
MLNGENIPRVLIDLPNWIVWKHEIRNKKPTKVPYDAKSKGVYAKSNDVATWATFDVAFAAANDILNDYDGVGFMLQGTDLVGIDFDGVLHDGVAEPYVLDILEKLGNPYCEITPSGNGLRAFVQCAALPAGQRKFSGNHYGAEIYSGAEGGRYLTCTSNQFSGNGVPKILDISLAYFMVSQIRNDKLKKLWMGDTSEYMDDQSRADLALLDILALLFNKDAATVEWAFNGSKLGQRDKWTERKDYRDRTIAKACAGGAPLPVGTKPVDVVLPPAEAVLRRGDEVVLKKIKWLWTDRVPLGKLTLYAGNPDNGKSLAALDLAKRITTGEKFPDCENFTPPSEVLVLVGEDDVDDTAATRLVAAHADMTKIHFLESMRRPGSSEESEVRFDMDLPALEKALAQHPNIRLIIVDPISNYLGDTSMVAEQDARGILIPLKRIAQRQNVAVVIVMHLNKKSELEAISRVGGAMAFIGVARCSWLFVRDATSDDGQLKDSFSMARIKNNLVKASGSGLAYHIEARPIDIPGEAEGAWTPYIVWDAAIDKTADDVLSRVKRNGPGRPEGTAPKLQEAKDWLEAKLQDGALTAKDIIMHAKEEKNIKEGVLRTAMHELGIKPKQIAREWMWELPEMDERTATVTADSAVEEEGYDHQPPVEREFDLR